MLALIHFALLLHLLLGQYLSSASDTVHVVTAENSNIPSLVPSHSPVAPSSTVSALSQLSSCTSSSCSSFFKPGDEDFSTDYAPLLPTFKIVGDNIDRHIKPREMRMDVQAKDMHYFNLYAVRDRVDVSMPPDDASLPDLDTIDVHSILPDSTAKNQIMRNFAVLIGRIIKKYMPFFATFASGLEEHILHSHYHEMCMKSEVVS